MRLGDQIADIETAESYSGVAKDIRCSQQGLWGVAFCHQSVLTLTPGPLGLGRKKIGSPCSFTFNSCQSLVSVSSFSSYSQGRRGRALPGQITGFSPPSEQRLLSLSHCLLLQRTLLWEASVRAEQKGRGFNPGDRPIQLRWIHSPTCMRPLGTV